MAKGFKCPVCGLQTVQPYTTNKMKCSKDGSVFDRAVILKKN